MPLHLRLTLWHVALAALVVLVVALTAYTLHVRSLYADVDQALADDAAILAPVLDVLAEATDTPQQAPTARASSHVRIFDADGNALSLPGSDGQVPPLTPGEVLASDGGPAYDPLVQLLPEVPGPDLGSFTVVDVEGGRERVYVLPVRTRGTLDGYVMAWTSLRSVDQSVARFRLLLLASSVAGLLTAAAGGLVVSRVALRPMHDVILTARAIERSRRFDARVPSPPEDRRDDLAELIRTLNDMLDSLEEAYRSQQRFVADAAHELRSPLTTLRGNLELIEANTTMPAEERTEALTDMRGAAERLSTLVDELLLLARWDAGEQIRHEPVRLDEVAVAAVSDLRTAPDRDRIHLDVEAVTATGDAGALRRLITILLDNARKYAPPPAAIEVRVRDLEGRPSLVVRDHGIGIDAEERARIFERFYRGERARRSGAAGAGLGLAIARSIAQQHGGEITVESPEDGGTKVVVSLPPPEESPGTDARVRSPRVGLEEPAG
ncbi:MAG: HAMP domain-containing sensor histidine kinase [Dehalococcoidia bacterium]